MMNTMPNIGWGPGLTFFYGLHMLSVTAFAVGAAFLLLWAFKHLSEKSLWTWGWALMIGGTLLCLVTFPAWPSFATGGMMNKWGGNRGTQRMMPMMWGAYGNVDADDAAAQEQEEAEGKNLFDMLQSKDAACDDFSDDDFELIGEYVMGQSMGPNHAGMNAMMKQMMGDDGEEQMHIFLGRSATGCGEPSSDEDVAPTARGGMMGGSVKAPTTR